MGPDGKLGNLNITDTGAEFRYGIAPKRTTISNRVCLFSPRFAVLRAETQPVTTDLIVATAKAEMAYGQLQLVNRVVNDTINQFIALRGFHSKVGPRGIQSRLGLAYLDNVVGLLVSGTVEGVAFSGKSFDRTVVTSSLFEYLRPLDGPQENLVDQTGFEPVTS